MRRYETSEMGNPGGKCHFFFVLCLVVALVFAIKINRNTY